MVLDIQSLRSNVKQPYQIVESTDGTSLFLWEWKPQKSSDTAVLILHGITAYGRPYNAIAEAIANAGFHTFALDLRGHGLSEGIRGDYPSLEVFLDDIKAALDVIQPKCENLILFGHSLGIITSLFALESFPTMIDGIILLSGARTIREGVYPKRSIFTTLKYLFWSLLRPSKPVIKYYRDGMQGLHDPLFNFSYTLRFLKIFRASDIVIPETLDKPLLFGIGEADELFSIESAKELFHEFPSGDSEFIVIKDAKHAEFPPFKQDDRLITWLVEKFG